MAKKKGKGLPKRIAGVKLPKAVRKGALGRMLASRTGQALIAEAIMAAGAVGVAKHAKDGEDRPQDLVGGVIADAFRRWQGAGRGHGHGHHHGHGRHNEIDPMGATVAFALGEAARAFVRTLNEHRQADAARQAPIGPEPAVAAEWRTREEAEDSKKKPGSWRPSPA